MGTEGEAPHNPSTEMTTANLNSSFECPFCSGSGKLPHFSHVANGDCFACGATGKLRDLNAFIGQNSDLVLTVWRHRGAFSSATLRRRTWKMSASSVGTYKTWGRDSFCREINDADQARAIWRDSKQLGISTELVD